MKQIHLALGGLVSLALLSSGALAIAPGQTGAFPTTGDWSGTTASGAAWDMAHSYVYKWNTAWNGNWYIGSAVAVAPNYLLTAGHVGATAGESYAVINGTRYTAVSATFSPAGADLCLVEVDKTLPGYATLYQGALSYGQNTFMVGYGVTGTDYGSYYTAAGGATAGIGRWGTNTINYFNGGFTSGSFTSSIFGMGYNHDDTPYEVGFGSGDSGGGTFVKVGDEWQLAGINAYATAFSVSVPVYANWITTTASVPEPGSLLLVASIMGLLGFRQRRPA